MNRRNVKQQVPKVDPPAKGKRPAQVNLSQPRGNNGQNKSSFKMISQMEADFYQSCQPTKANATTIRQGVKRTPAVTPGVSSAKPAVNNPFLLNAPTSLANLAQLSGISLTPISNPKQPYKTIDSNPRKSSVPSTSNKEWQPTQLIQTMTFAPSAIAKVSQLKPHQNSIANLKSITSTTPSHQPSTTIELSPKKASNMTNPAPKIGVNQRQQKTGLCNRQDTQKPMAVDIGVKSAINLERCSPPSDGKSAAVNTRNFNQSSNQIELSSSQRSLASFMPTIHDDSGLNDFSLLKLMAIFNNPALTITPVSNSPQTSSSFDCVNDGSIRSPAGTFTNQPRQGTTIFCKTNSQPMSDDYDLVGDGISTNRLPKSAANLEVIYGRNNFGVPGPESSSPRDTLNARPAQLIARNSDCRTNFGIFASSVATNNADQLDGQSPQPSNTLTAYVPTSMRDVHLAQQLTTMEKSADISEHLLRHIASQMSDVNPAINSAAVTDDEKSPFEPECILSIAKYDSAPKFDLTAKSTEKTFDVIVGSPICKKKAKKNLTTTRKRLCVRVGDSLPSKKRKFDPAVDMTSLDVELNGEREMIVSEMHSILDGMMPTTDDSNKIMVADPDDIFIDRSKRIMSKIDTEVERKKRKNFERISGRCSGDGVDEGVCAEYDSDDDWFEDSDSAERFNCATVVPIQLPLSEETITEEKKDHMSSLGLVSREKRNKISLKNCEQKLNLISQLAIERSTDVDPEIKRLVETLITTDGRDIQLRIESNIKRNDLPLLEGLNRNTSRVKMNFMSALGLEKRSKRTTLYKVKLPENHNHHVAAKSQIQQSKTDLDNKMAANPVKQTSETLAPQVTKITSNGHTAPKADITMQARRMAMISCREAMAHPSKNEYMKSLGLIAS